MSSSVTSILRDVFGSDIVDAQGELHPVQWLLRRLDRLDPDTRLKVFTALSGVGVLFACYALYIIYRVVFAGSSASSRKCRGGAAGDAALELHDHHHGKNSGNKQHGKNKAKSATPGGETTTTTTEPQQQQQASPVKNAAAASSSSAITQLHRSNAPTRSNEADALLKSWARIGALESSPCQRYVVASCRKSGHVTFFPVLPSFDPASAFSFASEHKKAKGEIPPFSLVVKLEDEFTSTSFKPLVTRANFSSDGKHVVLGERNHETFLVYSIATPSKYIEGCPGIQVTRKWKLSLGKNVSVLSPWSVHVINDASALAITKLANCEIEIIDAYMGSIGKDRYKIGNATCWAVHNNTCLAAGSYMTDVRVGELEVHTHKSGSGLTLNRKFMVPNAAKVTHMALIVPGTPVANTRHILVVLNEGGLLQVFDLDCNWQQGAAPTLLGQSLPSEDYGKHNKVTGVHVAVGGKQHHEYLLIALVKERDFVVYRTGALPHSGDEAPPVVVGDDKQQQQLELTRAMEIHDAHDATDVASSHINHFAFGCCHYGEIVTSCLGSMVGDAKKKFEDAVKQTSSGTDGFCVLTCPAEASGVKIWKV